MEYLSLTGMYFMLHPVFFYCCAAFFGLTVGSFLNVVIHRLPRMMNMEWEAGVAEFLGNPTPEFGTYNLAFPPSSCPACNHRIRWYENIPVISWAILLRGKCSSCGEPISSRYAAVEAIVGALFLVAAMAFGVTWTTVVVMGFVSALVALAFIDFETMLLPDAITIPTVWAGLAVALAGIGIVSLHDAVLGAIAGYMFLWVILKGYKIVTGRDGMGYGDLKLLAAIGAWLGALGAVHAILLASLSGAAAGVMYFIARKKSMPFAFGPHIAIGGIIVALMKLY